MCLFASNREFPCNWLKPKRGCFSLYNQQVQLSGGLQARPSQGASSLCLSVLPSTCWLCVQVAFLMVARWQRTVAMATHSLILSTLNQQAKVLCRNGGIQCEGKCGHLVQKLLRISQRKNQNIKPIMESL